MKETNDFQKKALDELVEKAPDFLESLGKALNKGADINDLRVEISAERFDGSYATATIDFEGEVEWEI